jgi:hypothetical protein
MLPDLIPKSGHFLNRIKPKSTRLQVLGIVMVLIVFVVLLQRILR